MLRPSGLTPMARAVSAVDREHRPGRDSLAVGRGQPVDVGAGGALHRLGHAVTRVVLVAHQLRDPLLVGVGQLAAVAAEELDAVVLVGVVRGGDDGAQRRLRAPREHGHAGRRDHPRRLRPAAGRDDALDECRLEPDARLAGIAADQDAAAGAGKAGAGSSQAAGQCRRQIGTGDAAHAVGPEELARCRHGLVSCGAD
jgi:hypothetical protein